MNFHANGSERMRILTSGGITFNGDTAQANALDDYEEGTFTPTLEDSSSGNAVSTYFYRTGVYTKIGNVVHITIRISPNNMGTLVNASDELEITGLPFAARSSGATNSQSIAISSFNSQSRDYTVGLMDAGSSAIQIFNITAGGWATVKGNTVVGGGQQSLTATYITDA
jgi:hypothetical protein